jgi:hypothetical protein
MARARMACGVDGVGVRGVGVDGVGVRGVGVRRITAGKEGDRIAT